MYVCIILWFLLAVEWTVDGEFVLPSPCPNIFQYRLDSTGKWRGFIAIPLSQSTTSIRINVELAVDSTVIMKNISNLQPVGNNEDVLTMMLDREKTPVQYQLYFTTTYPLPVVRSIISNNNIICRNDDLKNSSKSLHLQHILSQTKNVNTNEINKKYLTVISENESSSTDDEASTWMESYMKFPDEISTAKNQDIEEGLLNLARNTKRRRRESGVLSSPCPTYFQYKRDGSGDWYGSVSVPNPYPTVAIELRVELYTSFDEKWTSRGSLRLDNPYDKEWERMKTGENYFIKLKLVFPVQTVVPRLKSITFNEKIICKGPELSSDTYYTAPYKYHLYDGRCDDFHCPYNTLQAVVKPTTTTSRPISIPTSRPITTTTTRAPTSRRPIPGNKNSACGIMAASPNELIVNGYQTVPGDWPWHVAVYRRERYICGGSFIKTKTIITAAHCVFNKNLNKIRNATEFTIYLGRFNLREDEDGSQKKKVSLIFVPRTYSSTSGRRGDIAVMILSTEVQITQTVRPLCLWDQQDDSLTSIVNKLGVVIGWGDDENGQSEEKLKMVKMPVVDWNTCTSSDTSFYSESDSRTTFCAGYRNDSGTCNGDSGGGMVFPKQQRDGSFVWMLRGIVSYGKRKVGGTLICDNKNFIVFTDVAKYLDWIGEIQI